MRREYNYFVLALLWSVAYAFNADAEWQYRDPMYGIQMTVPSEWVPVSEDIFDICTTAMRADASKHAVSINWRAIFKLKTDSDALLENSIIVLMHRGDISLASKFRAGVEFANRMQSGAVTNAEGIVTSRQISRTTYDPERNLIQFTDYIRVGDLNGNLIEAKRGLFSLHLTAIGAIGISCRAETIQFLEYRDGFTKLINSVTYPEEINYVEQKSLFGLPESFTRGMGKGIVFGIIGLFVWGVRELKQFFKRKRNQGLPPVNP